MIPKVFFSFILFFTANCAPAHKYPIPQNFFNTLEFSKIDDDIVVQFCHEEKVAGKNNAAIHKLFNKSYDVILSDGKNSGTVELLESADVFYFKTSDDNKKLVKLLAMCT